jgi:phosphoglucosamine mutase
VILGRDTRESGPWIAATLAAGLREAGARSKARALSHTGGRFLARTHGFQAGVVISASHNPWRDNGIKLFGADGFKLPDAWNWPWKTRSFTTRRNSAIPIRNVAARRRGQSALQADYIQFLIDCVPGLSLSGLRIVADCANGAAAAVAPSFSASQYRRQSQHHSAQHRARRPQHQRQLRRAASRACGAEVRRAEPTLGLTFDGDADRCMLAGRKNNVINGDAILLMAARDLKARGLLTGDLVVATTMSNMGLEAALKRSGIRMLRAPVGDRYVLEADAEAQRGPGRRTVRPHPAAAPGHHGRRPADRAWWCSI